MTTSSAQSIVSHDDLQPDVHSASESYADRFRGAIGEWMLNYQAEVVLELLRGESVTSVLEVGGGHAQLTPHLCNAGYSVTVQGSAPECANRIQSLLSSRRCTFVLSSMLALPYPDNSFDAVVCIRQLNHLLCWPELLKEIGRVARRVVIVEYPALCSFNCIQSMMFPIKHALEGNTRKFLVFSSSEISAAASAAKLKSQKRTPQFFLPVGVIRQMRLPALVALLEGLARALGMVKLFGSPVIHKLSKVQD